MQEIFATPAAFTALSFDGSIFSWGLDGFGATNPNAATTSNIESVANTNRAFAAVDSQGAVYTWGDAAFGGDSSDVSSQLQSSVVSVYSTKSSFAALKSDGSVVTWGDPMTGGDSSSVISNIDSGVISIFATDTAFAALKGDGTVVTWGNQESGGDSSSVIGELASISSISSPYSKGIDATTTFDWNSESIKNAFTLNVNGRDLNSADFSLSYDSAMQNIVVNLEPSAQILMGRRSPSTLTAPNLVLRVHLR